jgi:hypothetical protein
MKAASRRAVNEMPSAIILFISIVLIAHGALHAQSLIFPPEVKSIDVPVDPQSVAMGESFVAVRANPAAFIYNPAALSGFQGIRTVYSRRDYNTMQTYSDHYESYVVALSTPIGNIGFFYEQYLPYVNLELPVYPRPVPTGIDQNVYTTNKNSVYGIAAAKTVSEHIDAGAAIKAYDESGYNMTGKTAYLFDAGIIYHTAGPLARTELISDEISGGLSVQNLGSDFDYNLPTGETSTFPRYVRIGFAYSYTALNENKEKLAPFKFRCTGEYGNVMNTTSDWKANRDSWGLGMEATLFEVLTLRVGGYIPAISGLYGSKGTPSYRAGFGVNMPMKILVPNSPLVFNVDYAAIPISFANGYPYSHNNTTFQLFSIGITYNNSLF